TTWNGASLTTAINDEWDDYGAAIPIYDVQKASQKIFDATGYYANALVVSRKVYKNLRLCEQIIEAIQAQGAGQQALQGQLGLQKIAEVLDLKYIFVGGGIYDAAKEGQSRSIQHIWSPEYAMVCRVAETDDIQEPCIGRTWHWAEDGSMPNGVPEQYYEP